MPAPAEPYAFLPVEGEGLHQIPVGPVHAGIIEPGHFRFTANGETVVRLEQRLGYVHKGIEGADGRREIARGRELAGRISGDSTVAYAWAFARAVEAALGMRRRRRAPCCCARSWPSWSGSRTTSATSARSATTRPSPHAAPMRHAARRTCCAPPTPASATA